METTSSLIETEPRDIYFWLTKNEFLPTDMIKFTATNLVFSTWLQESDARNVFDLIFMHWAQSVLWKS